MSRSRAWCFTLNNYDESSIESIRALVPASLRYVCFGREVGESGTPHLQGFAYSNNPVRLATMGNFIPRAHWEAMRGTCEQAITYCQKEGQSEEIGERPVSQLAKGAEEKERWKKARSAAIEGRIEEIDDDIFIRFYRTLKEIKKDHMAAIPDAEDVSGVWIYGAAGVGKSRKAREDYPDAYLKMCNKWWDGYQGQPFVIIDDVDKKHECLGHHFKIWGDRYSFLAETKGGAVKIRPEKIVVTSQYSIEDIWEDEETRAALRRRFKVTHMLTL